MINFFLLCMLLCGLLVSYDSVGVDGGVLLRLRAPDRLANMSTQQSDLRSLFELPPAN